MNDNEIVVLKQLKHQWYVRGNLTNKQMMQALGIFMNGKNPFRNSEIIQYLEENETHNGLLVPEIDIKLIKDR